MDGSDAGNEGGIEALKDEEGADFSLNHDSGTR